MNEPSWFFEWQRPVDFLLRRANVSRLVPDSCYRTQRNKWLREAWVLGLFATATDATELRLVKNDPPDGEIRLADKIVPVEIVEAFEEGREPAKEFKTGQRKHLSMIADWNDELDLIKVALDNRISKKESHANYEKNTLLVVYLNMGNDPRSPQSETVECLKHFLNRRSPTFYGICIIWRNWLFGPQNIVKEGRATIDFQILED